MAGEARILTSEAFERYEYQGGGGGSTGVVAGPGVIPKLTLNSLPTDARRRLIWIAAGAFWQDGLLDQWVVQGKLNFYLGGQKTGEFWFGDASQNADATTRANASRTVLRLEPSGLGSSQPVLTYQESSASAAGRNDLDIHCFELVVDCNRMEFEVEHSYYNVAASFTLRFLLGLRVVSLT